MSASPTLHRRPGEGVKPHPVDDAVFEGSSVVDGVPCVHPIQVYLDLKAQPERSQEAADELKRRLLTWNAA